jgi:hypothetical protein
VPEAVAADAAEVAELPARPTAEAAGAAPLLTDDAPSLADEPPGERAGEVTGAAAWLTAEVAALTFDVTGAAAWLTAEVAGATAWVTLAAARETPDEAALPLPLELLERAGLVTAEAPPLTALVTPFRVPVTGLVTAPSRPPDEPDAGADDAGVAGAARLVMAACALEPDISQNTAIKPRQQPASTKTRVANRPTPLRSADSHVSGTAYSTPVQPP